MALRGPPGERTPAKLLSFGIVNVDKPPGPSAHEVSDWVKSFVNDALAEAPDGGDTGRGDDDVDGDSDNDSEDDVEYPSLDHIGRVAHVGTLDPKVTGSLPMLLGDATRLARVFDDSVKEYVAVLELHGPPPADFEAIVAEFEGEIYQKPPRKSAVKRQLRVREIYDLQVLEREERRALLRVRCEAGTYVRKLCHDIGLALGTGAHMGDLRRTATGRFDDTDLVSMETFVDALGFWVEDGDASALRDMVRPAEIALEELPRVTVAPSAAREISHGAQVFAPGVIEVKPAPVGERVAKTGSVVACFLPNGAAVCLGRLIGDPDADTGVVVELERVLV